MPTPFESARLNLQLFDFAASQSSLLNSLGCGLSPIAQSDPEALLSWLFRQLIGCSIGP